MKFSVIYTVDCARTYQLPYRMPRGRYVRAYGGHAEEKNVWFVTERDDQFEYDYLADEGSEEWRNGRHRKVCGLVDRATFERFQNDQWLTAEDCETMGSIGAPGGYHWQPAISFNGPDDYDPVIRSAYVTPIPEPVRPRSNGMNERDWDRVRKVIIAKYQ